MAPPDGGSWSTDQDDAAELSGAPAPDFSSLVIDAAPDGIVISDRRGIISHVNRRIEELFGYERGALVGQPVEILLPESERQVHTADRLRYIARPRVRPMGGDLDLWARRSDGACFPVEVSLSPLSPLGLTGEQLVIATVRDVTVRRAAEQRMRNMSHLLGAIGDAVCLADPDTLLFTYVNAAACTLTGYDESTLLTMTPAHVLPDLDEPTLRARADALVAGEAAAVTVTTTLRRRTGIEVAVDCELQLPPVLRGQPQQLVLLLRDVTARLELEAETREAQELVALIDERERIAGDLHDTVIQDLFAAGLLLHGIATRAEAAQRERIMEIVDHHDEIIRRIRVTIFHLTERRDRVGGFQTQVSAVVEDAARILGFPPSLHCTGPVDTAATPAIIEHLVPSLREALSNVARHAQASRVDVGLDYHDGCLTMRLVDDGVGLPARPDPAGNGLRNLARRAEQLGASMTIGSSDPHGTTIVWTVPT